MSQSWQDVMCCDKYQCKVPNRKVQKFCSAHTLYLCVLNGSQNKQRLFLYTALTYRFL